MSTRVTKIKLKQPDGSYGPTVPLGTTADNVIFPDGGTLSAKLQAINSAVAGKLALTGGTMSGIINMNNNKIQGVGQPVSPSDAANKQYVETYANGKLSLNGGTLKGALNMSNKQINGLGDPTAASDAVNKKYADTKLSLQGGAMRGQIDMSQYSLHGLPTPTLPTSAVNKSYVDPALTDYVVTTINNSTWCGLKFKSGFFILASWWTITDLGNEYLASRTVELPFPVDPQTSSAVSTVMQNTNQFPELNFTVKTRLNETACVYWLTDPTGHLNSSQTYHNYVYSVIVGYCK